MNLPLTPRHCATLDETIHAERIRRLRLRHAAINDPALQVRLMSMCANDPHFWLDNFASTYNPKKSGAYVPGGSPHIPFLAWDFQRPVIDLFLGRGPEHNRNAQGHLWPVVQDKSRELGATWILALCAEWDWLFNEGADYGFMTRSGTDLAGPSVQTLFGKLDYALSRLPHWMAQKVDRIPEGRHPLGAIRYKRIQAPQPTLYNCDTGASIGGSKTVPDAFRGQRQKRTIVDEGASVPGLGKVMQSLNDVSPAPWVVSTPKGRGNFFASLVHGEGVTTLPHGEHGLGWCHHRMHYRQHPERDPETPEGEAWMEAEKARRTTEGWAQEQEIDYSASAPGRIWPDFNTTQHILTPEEWRSDFEPWLRRSRPPIYEGWDFGSGPSYTAAVWAAYDEQWDRLILLDYRMWREADFDTVADDVGAAGWYSDANTNGRMPYRRVGDCAGKQRDSSQRSWLRNLGSRGMDLEAHFLANAELTRAKISKAIRDGRLICAPRIAMRYAGQQEGVPTMAQCIEQYRRNIKGDVDEYVGDTPKALKDKHSHAADALQYIADAIWPSVRAGMRAQDEY